MLIAHVTDPHLGLDTTVLPGHPGPATALRRALAHVRQIDPMPDVLLLTGDLTEAGKARDYEALKCMLQEELPAPSAGGPLVLAVPGNHDSPSVARQILSELMPVAADAPEGRTCLHMKHGLMHFIGLDTVVPGQSYGLLDDMQLDWLEAQLKACMAQPTVIFMHHPPIVSGIEAMDSCGLLRDRARLGRLVAAHGDVQLIAAGHLHRPLVGSLGGAPVMVAPSSSHQIDLNLLPGAPLACRLEPPVVGLYRHTPGEGIACHFSYVDQFSGPFPI
ncbi:metallophosphoesterase [Ottowia caeni]|uniref:metallophosphoesterase n=1 Tax=Ottowia caeni TaxID=2870339 RepID=UPI001E4C33BA|nr:metallophosphoesterase [Ottowia caeni]